MDEATKKKLPGMMLLSFSTFVVCIPAAFTQILSFNLMFDMNAFPSTDYSWTFPMFVAGECASMGLCAGLIDRYGRKMPYLFGALMFMIASILCAVSTEMGMFIAFRFIQGFGAGIIIVTCIAQIYFDIENQKDRYVVNGIMSLGFGGGMLVGLFVATSVDSSIGWRTAFWILVVLQAIVFYPCLQVLSNGKKSHMKADVLGAVILTIWAAVFVLYLQKVYIDWHFFSIEGMMGLMLVVLIFLVFLLVETRNPDSVFHRKVNDGKLVTASLIFIVLLGAIDMAGVGCMVKIAFFTYQMSVVEAAPFIILLVLAAAITAVTIAEKIDKTGHLPWLLLSAVLSPIALLSMHLVRSDDPAIMLAVHLFLLGLAIGCLISMLNATIQNRTNHDNNGAMMSFAMMIRTVALWLGYNFYTKIADRIMSSEIGETMDHWNAVMPIELPTDSTLANLLITPLQDVIKMIPGLSEKIAQVFSDAVAQGFTITAVVFVVVSVPVSLMLVGRRKRL